MVLGVDAVDHREQVVLLTELAVEIHDHRGRRAIQFAWSVEEFSPQCAKEGTFPVRNPTPL